MTDQSDKYLVGWAYWQFKFFEDLTTSAGTGSEGFYNSDGSLQDWKVKALTRSYLMATQGTPTLMHFETSNANFTAIYTINTDIDAPTIIYLNKQYWYPNGYDHSIKIDGEDPPVGSYSFDTTEE